MKYFSILSLLLMPLTVLAGTYTFVADKGMEFSWKTEDIVGITPALEENGSYELLAFWTSSSAGASRNDRSLYATGYLLKDATTYYSYYPYRYINDFNPHNVTFSYTEQKQSVSNPTSHLYNYDYSIAKAVVSDGSCTFRYSHLGSVLRITFAAPTAITASSVTISADKPSIPQKVSADIVSGTTSFVSDDVANSISLSLGDNGISLSEGMLFTAYITLPAVNLSSTELSISLKSNSGETLSLATIAGPNLRAGYLYDIDLTKSESASSKSEGIAGRRASQLLATNGNVRNPIAHSDDILIYTTFKVQYIRKRLLGDVNNDGVVDTVDAVELNGYYLSGKTSALDPEICDVNNDGVIDVVDVIAIISIYLRGK